VGCKGSGLQNRGGDCYPIGNSIAHPQKPKSYIINLYFFYTVKYKENVACNEDIGMVIFQYYTNVSRV
jgi:hypothetical protein